MPATSLQILMGTAVSVALVHTLIGVDHTLPFVVLGKARGWSMRRVLALTAVCGLGHVGSSIGLGLLGVGLGLAAERLSWVESQRGTLAAWALIAFGLTYAVWGLWRGLKRAPHTHPHLHGDGTLHRHGHQHLGEHAHPHPVPGRVVTTWALFVIFVLGPCEPLIPLMLAPALLHEPWSVALVVGVFSAVTVGTMMVTVALLYAGLRATAFAPLERYAHGIAGLCIAGSGLAIELLGI